MDRINELFQSLMGRYFSGRKQTRRFYVLSAVVLLVTSYILMVPAVSLEKERAEQMGGIYLSQGTLLSENEIPASDSLVSFPAQIFKVETEHVAVSVEAPEGAFPAGTEMKVSDIEDEGVIESISSAVDGAVNYVHAVDITFSGADGQEIEPMGPVSVSMKSLVHEEADKPVIVHVDDAGMAEIIEAREELPAQMPEPAELAAMNAAELIDADDVSTVGQESAAGVMVAAEPAYAAENATTADLNGTDSVMADGDAVYTFQANSFSVYALVGTTIEKTVLASDGQNYRITVTYGPEAGIPNGADLVAEEIMEGSSLYDAYVTNAESALGLEAGSLGYIRLFDIRIVNAEDHGIKYQPADGTKVDVRVELADRTDGQKQEELSVVHFADGSESAEVVNNTTESAEEGQKVLFEADGFSVYAIVGTVIEKTVLASDGRNYKVTVTFGAETGIPVDADLSVEEILPEENGDANTFSAYEEYVSKTENALGWEAGSASYARVFDIKIVDRDDPFVKYQPTEGNAVDVRIELADAEEKNGLNVVHFANDAADGEVVVYSSENGKDGSVVEFAADGFSIYVIADSGDYSRLIYRFHDADGSVISTQYVKKYTDTVSQETVYESLYDPGLVPEYGQRLVGWAYTEDETDSLNIYQLEDLNNHIVEKLDSASHVDEETVDVYAIMDDAWYLRYMDVDENGNVKILKTERISRTAEDKHVDINLVVDLPEGVHYQGWYDPVLNETYSEHLYEGEHEQFDTIRELNRHLDLYLKLDNRVWLVFDANAGGPGSGATYTPPQMLYTNAEPAQATTKPDDPSWKGYTFTGWNTKPDGSGEDWLVVDSRTYDADGNLISTQYSTNKFGEELEEDVILYAQWTPDDNFYRIAYWRQKETDSVDASDSEKKYDFYGYREINGGIKTGDTVSATANDRNYSWVATQLGKAQGDENKFSFNTTNSDLGTKTVAGDGSTALNMYFDREVMTFIFNQSFNWYTETEDTSGVLYGYVDGEYVELTKGEMVTTYSYTTQYAYTASNDTNNNRYGLINGEYVGLTRESYVSIDGGATAYTGVRYNITNGDNGTQYGIVGGKLVELTSRQEGGGCSGTTTVWYANGEVYKGTRYVQANNGEFGFDPANGSMTELETLIRYTYNNNPYNGTRYSRSNSNTGYTGTRYNGVNGISVTDHVGQQYGIDANGGFVPLNRSSETVYSSFTYEDDEGSTHEYTGTFYIRGTTDRIRGLYGSQMKPGEWPSGVWQFASSNANSYSGNNRTTLNAAWTSYTISAAAYEYNKGTSPYTTWHLYSASLPTGVNVVYWRQDADGNYTDAIRTTGGNNNTLTIANNKFYGFTAFGYEYGGTGGTPDSSNKSGEYGWHDLTNLGTGTTSLTMRANNGDINIYYQRDKFNVTFQSNDASSNVRDYPEAVFYEKNLGFLKDWYTPDESDGREGYFFTGWYSDANFTKPFDFENETMPHNDIVLYGKWDTYRVRVVLVPTKYNLHNDEVYFPNDQSLSFRLDYNDTVSDANINPTVATRTGYKLAGWYTTPDFQDGTEWNFDTQINSRVPAVNMNYQQSEDWANDTYGDNDGKHDNVEGILKLYAKWEFDFSEDDLFIEYEVPESYVKRDALGNLITEIPQDNNKYSYNSNATSLSAVIKGAPENYLDAFTFDKWEVLDSANVPTGVSFSANDTAFIADALPIVQIRQVTDDTGATRNMKVVVLRATFSKNNNNKGTVVTFDGNGGVTVDNQSDARTLTLLVNEDFMIPGETGDNAFEREGYSLIGWSFDSDTTADEFRNAADNADSLQDLALQGLFEPNVKVAADNQTLSELNNWDPLSNTVYAVWEPHKFTISVKKIVADEEMSDKEFTFSAEALAEWLSDGGDVEGFTLVNNQTETIDNVPYGTNFTLTETPFTGYVVQSVTAKQISDSDGNPLDENDYIDLQGEDGKEYEVKGNIEITYTNKLTAIPLILRKVGYNNTDSHLQDYNLAGAAFTVYTTENGNKVAKDAEGMELKDLTSGTNGIFYTGMLQEGTYYLYESHVPDGYISPGGRVKMIVSADEITIHPTWVTGSLDSVGAVSESTDAETGIKTYTVLLRNTTGVSLPSTGGNGIGAYHLIGELLILLTAVLLVKRKRVS